MTARFRVRILVRPPTSIIAERGPVAEMEDAPDSESGALAGVSVRL